jgi:hypothetical protein
VQSSSASYGGGICIDLGGSSTATVEDSIIGGETETLGNDATLYGGGLFVKLQGAPQSVTISGTQVVSNTSANHGGGIHLENAVNTQSQSTITPGSVVIQDSVISGNTSDGSGGGVFSRTLGDFLGTAPDGDALRIERTTVAGNTARFNGGGVYASFSWAPTGQDSFAPLTISDTTISGNVAYNAIGTQIQGGGGGGGLFLRAPGANVNTYANTIINSTISGNRAKNGGGVYINGNSYADVAFRHSTIAFNMSGPFDPDEYPDAPSISTVPQVTGAGGIFFFPAGLAAHFDHTIVAMNGHLSDETGLDHDHPPEGEPFEDNDTVRNRTHDLGVDPVSVTGVEGTGMALSAPMVTFTSDYSIFGRLGEAYHLWNVFDITGTMNQIGSEISPVDPDLGPLAPNGGPTLTHLPAANSEAVDAGNPALDAGVGTTPEFDQRGDGFTRVFNDIIDIGAVERQVVEDDCRLLGDYNDDGSVDAGDYIIWRKLLGTMSNLPNADPSVSPGTVSHGDYLVWKEHFGEQCAMMGGAAASAVTSDYGFNSSADNEDQSISPTIADATTTTLDVDPGTANLDPSGWFIPRISTVQVPRRNLVQELPRADIDTTLLAIWNDDRMNKTRPTLTTAQVTRTEDESTEVAYDLIFDQCGGDSIDRLLSLRGF